MFAAGTVCYGKFYYYLISSLFSWVMEAGDLLVDAVICSLVLKFCFFMSWGFYD